MRDKDLEHLVCPRCQSDLTMRAAVRDTTGRIGTGELRCSVCDDRYPIVGCIPRFVTSDNYASNFGLQWLKHAKTQFDSVTGLPLSRDRFFGETGWPERLDGELILEAGSGAGRFTEVAAWTGAFIVSFDYSRAVEANFRSNGHLENVLIVRADIYAMPFRRRMFDRAMCIGVLQHTPDVERSFLTLPPMIRPGGRLVVDVYRKSLLATYLHTKYLVRFATSRMDPETLYERTSRWVETVWPLSALLRRIPRIGPSLNWRLLIPDYSTLGLSEEHLKEWARLDIFDMLAPRYDSPQTERAVRQWHRAAGLVDVEMFHGYNGLYCRSAVPVER